MAWEKTGKGGQSPFLFSIRSPCHFVGLPLECRSFSPEEFAKLNYDTFLGTFFGGGGGSCLETSSKGKESVATVDELKHHFRVRILSCHTKPGGGGGEVKRDLSISRECQKNHSRAGVDISELPLPTKGRRSWATFFFLPQFPISDRHVHCLCFPRKCLSFREKKRLFLLVLNGS